MQDREHRLRLALEADPALADSFDFILMDCPPSLGLLTLNALVAAHSVLVPLQTEFFALEGVSQITQTIEPVERALNPALALEGILLTMYDRRNNLSELVAQDVRGFFKDKVFETVIPRNIRLTEAPSHGLPVSLYDARSPGAQAYAALAAECSAAVNSAHAPHEAAMRLGRGLSALMGEAPDAHHRAGEALRTLPIEMLEPGPFQPRGPIDPGPLQELADSIRNMASCSPSWCGRSRARPGEYQIIGGERRWRAAQLAQLHEVPVVIRNLDDKRGHGRGAWSRTCSARTSMRWRKPKASTA